jgi:all-beta uncharacterized protein
MRYHRLLLASAVSAAVALAAASCAKTETSPSSSSTSTSCSVTLGSTTTSVSAAATSGTIAVTAASTCAWTAVSSASFLTVTSGATGTGNGSVGYSVAANTGAARSASILVNGTAVVFTQSAAAVTAPSGCSVRLDTTNAKANSGGATVNVAVTADSSCGWTASSNASFLTIASGASGSGNGTVSITVAANGGQSRSGTVTIGGQTVTISQDPGVFASFSLFDPAQTTAATTVCQIRSASGAQTTCTLRSTSFTSGANPITTYTWTVQYTYVTVKVTNATGAASSVTFSDTCGLAGGGATDSGAMQPLSVTLTVTDSLGNTATAQSGSGSQPPLFVQLFNCGL